MTTKRSDVVIPGEEHVYHCTSRCVRRAFLCGYDCLTKKNFDYRKQWIRERLEYLTTIFTIEVIAFAIMCNHSHEMLRTRPDLLKSLTDEEVAIRWLTLYPKGVNPDGTPNKDSILALTKSKKMIKKLRKRLDCISWFMKSINEYIARLCNAEDEVTGRFWEGRFQCERLEGEGALLACAVYVDLNPVRAGMAETPEESLYTSVWERISHYKSKEPLEDVSWLTPIQDTESRKGFLSMELGDYLRIVDYTGKERRKDKRGAIPSDIAPILTRLELNVDEWFSVTEDLDTIFGRIVGNAQALAQAAKKVNKRWFHGVSAARRVFVT
ncbi:transposase [Candidatus Saccharibacteria bacterium]|nr:transposase [Candidatus Saccharibacteria bacterium]